MTNNSIFTRVLALMICLVMLVGTLTACFNEVDGENHTGTTTNGEVTTKPTTTTTTTGDMVEDEPTEDPVDPNVIFSASTNITSDSLIYGTLASDVVIGGAEMGALVPADVKVEAGASSLALSVKKVDEELLGDALSALDVHINGIALDNTVPMIVKLGAILEAGLGATELKLYHTENGVDNLMTRVNSPADFAIHNQYYYNAETGEVTIYIASFSVISAVKSVADVWDENTVADTSWYNAEKTEFILEDVADFLGFRDLVDGGNTFEGKTVTLATDIDLVKKPFDPIGFGYYDNDDSDDKTNYRVFMGTFDGGNHTIYNLYENCWELDPNPGVYDTYTYSTAGAGLFASVKDATIKNIAINGAEVVFECIDMGVLVGYAQGECHFENIVISNAKIANYNRYTGGLVGEVSYGVDKNEDGYTHTFKNITIDSTVTVSGLWGSFGCGMGGVIGGKWGDATVYMENVVSAPVMDVYNDVVSAYQWYAFRGCGMLIGHTEEPYSDGRTSGNATASFLTCVNVNVYYGDWTEYNYYEFAKQDNATGRNYPWVRAEEGNYCDAFSNIRYGVPTHTVEGVTTAVSELSQEELEKVATDHVVITFDQLYGADRGMYGTNKHEGVNVSYKSPQTFYIKNNVGWKNLTLHYTYEIGEETWTTVPEGVELFESNGVYRVDLPEGAISFTITADGGYTSKVFIVSELTKKETYPVHEHEFNGGNECECGATQTETWEKLTSETELKVGDFIVFVYENGKMELSSFSTTKTIYGIGTEFNTLPNGTMTFEVVKGFTTGTIAFKNGDKYLYWTSDNSLDMNDTLNANTSWTVSVDENGNATVLNAKDNTRKLQWNATSPRFACYTSAQTAISIYVKTAKISCAKCAMQVVDHKDASCGVAGYTTTQCTVCGKVETTTTEALEHDYTASNPYICLNNCGIHNLPEDGSTITIQEAIWIAETLENGKGTSAKYLITGVINDKDHPSETGATTITVGESSIYITNIHNVDGSVGYKDFVTKPKDGDEITVSAKIAKNDSGEAQLRETWLSDHVDADENGVCDYCGTNLGGTIPDPEPDPETPAETTVSMDIFANKGTLANKVITWKNGIVTVSNEQGSSTTAIRTTDSDHFRVYKSSKVTISVKNATISKVVITCTSASGDYYDALKDTLEKAGYTTTINGAVFTITTTENVDCIEFTATGQTRINKIEVTYTTSSGSEGGSTEPKHTCESICDTCGKCTDTECTYDVCKNNQCGGHTSAPSWQKATSIEVGDTIVIVCESKKMELVSIADYGTGKAYTDTPNATYNLTVVAGSTSGTYAFKDSNGKYLSWSSGNSLKLSSTLDSSTSWNVTFSNGNALITNAKDSSRKLQWNASSPRFACYTSSQTAIAIFVLK